jgi:predicted  nucleic acid-binding Zn-ribbon protein
MKKFEVVFNDSNYDYVTKNMVLEYLKSAFTRADIEVKTVRRKKNASRKKVDGRIQGNKG